MGCQSELRRVPVVIIASVDATPSRVMPHHPFDRTFSRSDPASAGGALDRLEDCSARIDEKLTSTCRPTAVVELGLQIEL
jgi:hypothetical protein